MDLCRLENRFLNPRREGLEAANPLELNYRVMVSRDKPDYAGREAIDAALVDGPNRRLIGLTFGGGEGVPPAGTALLLGSDRVGTLVNGALDRPGPTDRPGIVNAPAAYVGLDFRAEHGDAAWARGRSRLRSS